VPVPPVQGEQEGQSRPSVWDGEDRIQEREARPRTPRAFGIL